MPVIINGTTGISGVDGSAASPAIEGGDTDTGMFFPAPDTIAFAEGGVEAMRIDSNGYLLVGTTSDLAIGGIGKLQIAGTGSTQSWISRYGNDQNGPVIRFAKSRGTTIGANSAVVASDNLGYLEFSGNTGSGNVTGASLTAEAESTFSATSTPTRMQFYTAPSGSITPVERMRIDSAGTLTSQPTYDNTAAGSGVVVTSAGLIRRTSSSIKYKKDVETLDSSLSMNAVLNLRPVWYRTKEATGDDKSTWSHIGLIAEEVHQVEPRLVRYRTVDVTYEDGKPVETPRDVPEPEDVDYGKLSVLLLDVVKKQQVKIEGLEARISFLELK